MDAIKSVRSAPTESLHDRETIKHNQLQKLNDRLEFFFADTKKQLQNLKKMQEEIKHKAKEETEKYKELLCKAQEKTYSETEKAEHLDRIAELERCLEKAKASASSASESPQKISSLENELKRQQQVTEKDIQVIKDEVLAVEKEIKQNINTRLDKIKDVLTAPAELLHYKKITEQILSEIKEEDANSLYVRLARSVYALTHHPSPEASDRSGSIFTAFGMFWSRKAVKWSSNPKLFGTRTNNETLPIDFCQKCAIYFLHDRRRIIYVSLTNRLGKSLYAHTNDSLSKNWDRFSWLHLTSSVPSSGTLGRQPSNYDDSQIKLVLAAILIEVWERGDRFKHAEYLQKVNPA